MNSKSYNVISNTTPIIALASIGKLDFLPKLFKRITIAEAVRDEINYGGIIKIPSLETIEWVNIKTNIKDLKQKLLHDLDEGEKQTILVALESTEQIDEILLLIDERKGRKIATSLGLRIKGTLGLLADAKRRGWIDSFKSWAFKLLDNNLYYDLKLIESISLKVDR